MNTEKEKRAIQYLRTFEPQDEPYYLCYSGGKDSDAIRILADLAGVKHEIWHNHTTVDAPETVRYVRSIPGVNIGYPVRTMWQLIVDRKIPPTRFTRYCCESLKEHGGKGRMKITGVRWAEIPKRKESAGVIKVIGKPKTMQKKAEQNGLNYRTNKQGGLILNDDNDESRRFVEMCYRTTSTVVNPIVDWTDADVWAFLKAHGCDSNPLYQCGYSRIGCIGCPLGGAKHMKREFEAYPAYKNLYIKAFDRMLEARRAAGLATDERWADGESVMRWWVGDDPLQALIEDYE